MTDQQYADWLASPTALRTVLLEIGVNSGGSETTRYIASRAYISASSDTPANTYYENRLSDSVQIQENLGMGNENATMSIGDIDLINNDGGIDSWLSDVFTNRPISIYLGDVSWPKSDFRLVYAGVMQPVDANDPTTITLRMSDKMQRLDSAMSETKLGGSGPNADALTPLCFGECHNVTPLLTNEGTLEYTVHNGPIESIIEVRDNGIPVNYSPNLPNGKFNLTVSPIGTITCSVQGDKPAVGGYSNNIATLIQRIVIGYGRTDLRFTTADIDTANFSTFAAAKTQPVGIYLDSATTVRSACQQLAAALGAKLTMSRLGLLRILQLALPSTPTKTVDLDDQANANSLRPAQRTEVAAAVKLAYCKNWTVQESLQAGVVAQHKVLFGQEWLTATATDTPTATLHKLSVDVEQEEALLLRKVDADAEALRRLNLRKVVRTIYEYQAFADHLQCELGQGIALSASRFNLSGGANGQIVSLQMDLVAEKVKVGVLA